MMNTALNLPELRKKFVGKLVALGDDEYDKLRVVFYGGFDFHPAVMIFAANAQDVVQGIQLAKETGLPLAVRSGGHSLMGHSGIEDGIVLDLRNMKALTLDVAQNTVWAESGLTASELTAELDKHGMVVGFGDTGSVGIGGITLGGGIGFLVRKYGMTIDNLLAVEIVTADGQVLIASESENPELFWAIRGGGGNFGVVTKFQFKLHALEQTYGGMLIQPAEPQVIAGIMDAVEKAPDELSMIVNVMPAPPMPFLPAELHGQMIVMSLVMFAGPPEQAMKVLEPIRALAKPHADLLRPMRYKEIFFPDDGSYHPTAVSHNMFLKFVDVPLAEKMLQYLNVSTAMMRVIQLRTLGGAMARVADDATAFGHRQSKIMVNVAALFQTEADKAKHQAWVMSFSSDINQGDNGSYVNFMESDSEEAVRAAYPEKTLARLKQVKQKYDPQNFFRSNYNISPA